MQSVVLRIVLFLILISDVCDAMCDAMCGVMCDSVFSAMRIYLYKVKYSINGFQCHTTL